MVTNGVRAKKKAFFDDFRTGRVRFSRPKGEYCQISDFLNPPALVFFRQKREVMDISVSTVVCRTFKSLMDD